MTSGLGNKEIMSKNIKRLLREKEKNQKEFCKELGFKETTVSDWINAKSYPRIDKIEIMANYFGVSKSELVEEFKPSYYLNPETAAIAQQIRDNPGMRILFDAAKDVSPEDLKTVADLVSKMRKQESGDYE